ncbi:hypothetical protein [Yersinia phage vB_YenM_P778]
MMRLRVFREKKRKTMSHLCGCVIGTQAVDWRYMPYGRERRVGMIAYMLRQGKVAVNKRYQIITKHDADIKYYLKRGILTLNKYGDQTYVKFTRKGFELFVLGIAEPEMSAQIQSELRN